MALAELITPTNVVKAAQFILNLDQSFIEEKHWPDLNAAIYWLKDSLDHYLHPQSEWWLNGMSQIEHVDYALKTLMEAVRSLLPCLSEEGKNQLRHYLLVNTPTLAMA